MTKSKPPGSPKPSQRHPLLFQQRFSEQIFWPSTLIIAVTAALLVWKPARIETLYPIIYAALVIATGVMVLVYFFRLRSYAQCRHDGLLLRLPFMRILIPYDQLKMVRPTEFARLYPLSKQRWISQRYLERIASRTVLVLDLDHYPRSPLWLRLWMNRYMLCPDRVGFILAVRDWMAFRRELDEYRARSVRR